MMKKTTRHLPIDKRDELKKVISIICKQCNDVEMIILFGSYARGDWKEEADLKPKRKSGHKSDYDILAVTKEKLTAKDTGIWHKIIKKCDDLSLSTHVRIISHDIQDINIQLAEGRYFFADIKKEGCLLFDSGNIKLARKRELKPDEEKRIAEDYYNDWFESAEDFWFMFEKCFETKRYKKAAFNLHQVTESSYKTILLVFTEYNPNEHYLDILGKMAEKHGSVFHKIFPQKTEKDRELFELLDSAYIRARYDSEYRIAKEQLEYLSKRVKILLELTERICKAKIESFTNKNPKSV